MFSNLLAREAPSQNWEGIWEADGKGVQGKNREGIWEELGEGIWEDYGKGLGSFRKAFRKAPRRLWEGLQGALELQVCLGRPGTINQ